MKTKTEFIERFEETLAGFGLWGVYIDAQAPDLKTATHAARALKVPERARKMLAAMYDFLMVEQPKPPVNGRQTQEKAK